MLASPDIAEGLPLLILIAFGTFALGVFLCYSGYRLYSLARRAFSPQRCRQCGRQVAALDAGFCPECRKAVPAAVTATMATSALAAGAASSSWVLLVVGAVLLLAGLLLAVVFGGLLAGAW